MSVADRLGALCERAAQAGVRFRLADGRVLITGRPASDLATALRNYRDHIHRHLAEPSCAWCATGELWVDDADTGLPICRPCAQHVGATRLAREGWTWAAWNARAQRDTY